MTSASTSTGIVSLRPFVPAKDLETSLRFYSRLGFTSTKLSGSLALLTVGDLGVLLQHFDLDAFAQNYMMQLVVADLNTWWGRVERLDLPSESAVQAPNPPAMQTWGLRVGYIFDPSGVLWHVTEKAAD